MENSNNSERIERYLTNQMTPDESEAFVNDLRSDKALREEAQLAAMAIKAMKEQQTDEDAGIIAEVAAEETVANNTKQPSSRPRIVRLMRWAASAAAIVAIVFGLSLYFKKQTSQPKVHKRTATVRQKDSILNCMKAQAQAEAEAILSEYPPFDGEADSAEYAALARRIKEQVKEMTDTNNEVFMAEYQKAVSDFETSLNTTK